MNTSFWNIRVSTLLLLLFSNSSFAQLLLPISQNRFEIGNTQAFDHSKATGLIISYWPNGNITQGTGVLVSRRHVLTVAHNLYWPANGGYASVIAFAPANHGSITPFGVSRSTRVRFHNNWLSNSTPGGSYDIGIFRLATPLGDQAGWMDLTIWKSDPKIQVNLNGYDADVYKGLHQITRSGSVLSIKDWPYIISRYRSNWFAPSGVSGGPVWYSENGRLKVIGVASSISMFSSIGTKNVAEFDFLFQDFITRYP